MGLQVRLRQGRDERIVDLAARTLKQPNVVGRAAEADLQVSSPAVSIKHCILFVHEGRWVAQSLATGGITTVNQTVLKGAVALRTGDQIGLGDAPQQVVIEIDPAGVRAGRTGNPVREQSSGPVTHAPKVQAAAVAAKADARVIPLAPRPTREQPATFPVAPLRPRQVTPPAVPVEAAEDTSNDLDMLQYAATSTVRKKPRRKQGGGGGGAIVVSIVALGAIGAGVYYVVKRHPIPPEAPAPVALVNRPPPKVQQAEEPEEHVRFHKNVFTSDPSVQDTPASDPSAPPPEIVAASTAPALARDPTSAAGGEAARNQTELTWNAVLDSADLNDEGLTILRIDDYAHTHPGQHTQELIDLKANAVDSLWWKRVAQLYARAKQLKSDIAGKEKELNEETNTAFRQQLLSEKADLKKQLDQARGILKDDMGYTSEAAPKTDTKAAIAAARAARDPAAYATWSASLKTYIRAHNGQIPWSGEQ